MSKNLSSTDYARIITIATFSATVIYSWANLATEGSLELRLFFTVGGVITAILFQIDNFTAMAKEEPVSCCTKTSWALQTIPSTLSNIPLAFLAFQGIDNYVSEPGWANLLLKVLAGYGCVEEAFFGVRGTSFLIDEFKRLFYGLLGLCSKAYQEEAYKLSLSDLQSDLETNHVDGNVLTELEQAKNKDIVLAYANAQKELPYSSTYHKVAMLMGVGLGISSACCYFYNAVEFVRDNLIFWWPEHSEEFNAPYTTAALWFANLYNIGFCTTYGNGGGRALLTKFLPLLVYGDARDRFACILGMVLAGVSMGPALEIANGANIWGAANIGLCYLPGTLTFGYRLYDAAFCLNTKKSEENEFGQPLLRNDIEDPGL